MLSSILVAMTHTKSKFFTVFLVMSAASAALFLVANAIETSESRAGVSLSNLPLRQGAVSSSAPDLPLEKSTAVEELPGKSTEFAAETETVVLDAKEPDGDPVEDEEAPGNGEKPAAGASMTGF